MDNGWIKTTIDGSKIYGSDKDVSLKKVSWSATPTTLIGTEIYHNSRPVIILQGLGEYHYSEDYDITVGRNVAELVYRRLQFYNTNNTFLHGTHVRKNASLCITTDHTTIDFSNINIYTGLPKGWFTIEYDVKNDIVLLSNQPNQI